MKAKIFSSISFAVLFLLVLTSFTSALGMTTPDFTGNSTTLTITTNSTESGTLSLHYTGDLQISFNETFPLEVTNDLTYNIKATIQNDTDDLDYGGYNVIFNATLNGVSKTDESTYEKGFYDGENKGELKVEIDELRVLDGFGDDDEYWYPLDEVEIIFNIDNNGDWDIENIEIEVCVWDENEKECVFDEDDFDIDLDDFDLKKNKDEDITMILYLDAENLESENNDYIIYIKAIGEIDDKTSEYNGDKTGNSDSEKIKIITDDNFVIINNIQIKEDSFSCGDSLTFTADVWNIGDKELEDDEVYVHVYNKELGIDKTIEFNSGIAEMDSEQIMFTVKIPENAEEKIHKISFNAYEKKSFTDKNLFENEEEDTSKFSYLLTIEKGSCLTTPTAAISAKLDSEAKAGKDLIVKATIVNTGSETKTFTISLDSYSDWAESATADKTSVTINAGASEDVLITLKVLSDAEGENGFDIEVLEGTKYMFQPVSVTIEKASFFPSLTGLVSGFGNNVYLYGIGALNLLLIAAIIFVAVKVARRKNE